MHSTNVSCEKDKKTSVTAKRRIKNGQMTEENSADALPSAATECYSPWRSLGSPASCPARKASPSGPCPPWIGLCRALPLAGSPSGGCWSPGSPLRDGSAPPRAGWRCSCSGLAAHGAVGALSWSRWPAGEPGRRGSGPAGGPCQGRGDGREETQVAPSCSAEKRVRWVAPFGTLCLLYSPSFVKKSLKALTRSSSCLHSPAPAAPVSVPLRADRKHTERKGGLSSIVSPTIKVQEINSRLVPHHLSLFWKVAFLSAFFQAVGLEEEGRGGVVVESGPLQDVGWSGKLLVKRESGVPLHTHTHTHRHNSLAHNHSTTLPSFTFSLPLTVLLFFCGG